MLFSARDSLVNSSLGGTRARSRFQTQLSASSSQHPDVSVESILMRIIQHFPDTFHLDISITKNVARRIANILMKRFRLQQGQEDSDSARKLAKPCSESH